MQTLFLSSEKCQGRARSTHLGHARFAFQAKCTRIHLKNVWTYVPRSAYHSLRIKGITFNKFYPHWLPFPLEHHRHRKDFLVQGHHWHSCSYCNIFLTLCSSIDILYTFYREYTLLFNKFSTEWSWCEEVDRVKWKKLYVCMHVCGGGGGGGKGGPMGQEIAFLYQDIHKLESRKSLNVNAAINIWLPLNKSEGVTSLFLKKKMKKWSRRLGEESSPKGQHNGSGGHGELVYISLYFTWI